MTILPIGRGNIRIIPVIIEDVEIPALLKDRLYIDLRKDFDAGMQKLIQTLALGALVIGLGLGTASSAAAGDPSEDCATCHDEIAADFAQTVHAVTDRGGPSCVTCHGNGDQHMDSGGDTTLIAKPQGANLETLCLTCHLK